MPIAPWPAVPLVAAFLSFRYLWLGATTDDRAARAGQDAAPGPIMTDGI